MIYHKPPCKEGDRVRLIEMMDDPAPIEPGTKGRVYLPSVQLGDEWVVHVKWDNGLVLNMCVPPDKFEVIG